MKHQHKEPPSPLKLKISNFWGSPPSAGVKVISSLPAPGTTKSVARYWSPKACLWSVQYRRMVMSFDSLRAGSTVGGAILVATGVPEESVEKCAESSM